MPNPAREAPCIWSGLTFMASVGQTPAATSISSDEVVRGRLPVVERVLGQLTPMSRSLRARFFALVTGTLGRNRLLARYTAYCQALGEGPRERRNALRALRAGFERYQDACSADDYLRVQDAYPEIDAALARLQADQGEAG